MPERLLIGLLDCAESWANRAGQSLTRRGSWSPATFTAGRRPEERAMLSCAAEVYDLLGATPEGCVLMRELGLDPDAAGNALPTHESLAARLADHRARLTAVGGTD